jgi:hypothetical protein
MAAMYNTGNTSIVNITIKYQYCKYYQYCNIYNTDIRSFSYMDKEMF